MGMSGAANPLLSTTNNDALPPPAGAPEGIRPMSARLRPLLLALSLSAATATLPPPLLAQPAGDDTITMNLRDADIRGLIQWVADLTGRNMVVHKDVEGRVTVLSAKPVTREEAYQIFLSTLQVNGFAAIETDEAVKIVPADQATQSGIPYGSSGGGDRVVQVFEARNVSAVELAQMLRPLVGEQSVIAAEPGSNMLVVADHARNVASLRQLVEALDRRSGGEAEMVRLRHANARELLASLQGLYPAEGNGGAMRGEGGPIPLQLSADERANAILIGGDSARRAQLRRLIGELDQPVSGGGNAQVVYLQYANAKEVAPILQGLSQSVLEEQKDTTTPVSIEASESANALVINAPPGLQQTMREVAEKLDIRRAQVLVEALIVEVSSDVSNELGVQWLSTDPADANDSTGFAGVSTLGDLGLGSVIRDDDGSVVGITPGRGITFGYFENGNLQAAIRALSATTQANILSTPTVVAIDNQPASLLVGQNVPFITGQATGNAAGVENPFTTIERRDIGISLEIVPRINQGDSITLEIRQKVENIAPSVESASDLITNKREIITTALVRDDSVLVLGGLISDEDSEIREKVPVLGDLPLIGRLFGSKSRRTTRNNLMVFIHPVILKDEFHVSDVTQTRYNFMRDQQREAIENPPTTTRKRQPATQMEEFDVFSPVHRNRAAPVEPAE